MNAEGTDARLFVLVRMPFSLSSRMFVSRTVESITIQSAMKSKRERERKGGKEARKKRKETLKGRVKQKMHITAESCWTQRNNAVSNFDVWTFPNPISAKTASHCNGALALRTAWRLSARNRVPRSLHRLKLGCTQTARRLHADCTQASRAVHFSS